MVDFPVVSVVVLTLLCLSSSLEMPYSSSVSRRYPSARFTRLALISWLFRNVLLYCWIFNHFFHFLVSLMSLWIHRSLHDLWDTIGLKDDGVSNSVLQLCRPFAEKHCSRKGREQCGSYSWKGILNAPSWSVWFQAEFYILFTFAEKDKGSKITTDWPLNIPKNIFINVIMIINERQSSHSPFWLIFNTRGQEQE